MKKQLLLLLMTLLGAAQTVCAQEAYAVPSDGGATVTFYYDSQKTARGGSGLTDYVVDKSQSGDITKLIIDDSFADYMPSSMSTWFFSWSKLTTIVGIENLNTEKVTTMKGMFHSCTALTTLDLTSFNTEKVTDMEGMFAYCSALTSVDLSSFRTAQVTTMDGMFAYCENLTTIYADETRWSTAGLTNTDNSMFMECNAPLTGGNGTSFWTTNYADDATYARIDKAGQPGYLTQKAGPAEAEPNAEPYAVCENGTLTFYYDSKKTERGGYDVGPFESSSTRWGGNKFSINKIIFDDSFAKCTTITSTAYWFEGFALPELIIIGLSNLKTDNVTDMSYMFSYCKAKIIDVSGFNTGKVTSMEKMFDDCDVTTLDVSNFKTDNVTNMHGMFESCNYLTSLDLSNFNTKNVTDMSDMFYGDSGLETLNISSFNTSNVTTMKSMFVGCSKLKQIDVSHFDTSNVRSMMQMFLNCKGLTSIDVSNFNTENVTVMSSMFSGCSALTQLGVSHFNTSKVIYMNSMFADCIGITSIDVSNFDIAKVQEIKSMFNGCSALKTIYSDATWFCSYSPYMFKNCTSLVGGAGTTYDADHIDVGYARVDGGTDAPGYFTSVNAKPKQCAKPVISMKDGKIVVDCETEGTEFVSELSTVSSTSVEGTTITIPSLYRITVIAKKEGYEDSDPATMDIEMQPGKKGDVNGDGNVSITDAVSVVNIILNNGGE